MRLAILYNLGIDFIRHLAQNKFQIYELTKRDFQSRYIQKLFGISWAILDPLAFILILWLVFGLGLRGGANMDIPFIAYLVPGFVAYTLFSQALTQATRSINAYSFLVKKVNFRISILPLVKIFSELFLHCIILIITVVVLLINGIYPSWYWFQLVYYVFALMVLLAGLSWLTSSINLFFPDIGNFITICTRFLFYLTPIFWQMEVFPNKVQAVLKLNPLYYIVNGYRDSLIFHRGFWNYPEMSVYYWAVTLVFLLAGIFSYKRLRPFFANVT